MEGSSLSNLGHLNSIVFLAETRGDAAAAALQFFARFGHVARAVRIFGDSECAGRTEKIPGKTPFGCFGLVTVISVD